MAIQARILIGGIPGSNDDATINTVVSLSNDGLGGEVTYLWQILDQPPGTADALSVNNQAACTLRPKKEGTYLIRLTVADAQGSTTANQVLLGVRQLKSRQRLPAAGETFEDNGTSGWRGTMNAYLSYLDNRIADGGLVVAVLGTNGALAGTVCRPQGLHVLKSGLPGEEEIAVMVATTAQTAAEVRGQLCVLISDLNGNAAPAQYAVCLFRHTGIISGLTGNPAVNDPVYVNDSGALSTTAGTVARQVGAVSRAGGGTYDVYLQGGGDALTNITLAGDVNGSPGSNTVTKLGGNNLNSAGARALLGLAIGANVQAYSPALAAVAGRNGAGLAKKAINATPFAPVVADFDGLDTIVCEIDINAVGGDLSINLPKPSSYSRSQPVRLLLVDVTGDVGNVGNVYLTSASGALLEGESLANDVLVMQSPYRSVELLAPSTGDSWFAPSIRGMFVRRLRLTITHAILQALAAGVKTHQFALGKIPPDATLLGVSMDPDSYQQFNDGGGADITVSTGIAIDPQALSQQVSIKNGAVPNTPFTRGIAGAILSRDPSGVDVVAEFAAPLVDLNQFTSGAITLNVDFFSA